MKAIILARVSTDEQMAEGQSIPAQLAKARQYASRKGLQVKSEYQFDESSVKDRRVKFEQVIEEITASKEPLALIVETIDRLQRSFKESVSLDNFRKEGRLEIHFIRENLVIHKNSNSSELTRWDIGVLFARNFVLQISDNVRRTIEFKIKNGEWPSRAPYGYTNFRNEDGKSCIAPDPLASRIVVKMYEWYGSEGYSMEQIRTKSKEEFSIEFGKGKIEYYETLLNGLQTEYKRLEGYISKMYDHLLQGRLTEEEYDKESREFRKKQDEIRIKLDGLQKADENYYQTAKYILALSNKAPEIFDSSEPTAKRQLLRLLLQNCVVDDATLVPTIRSPFHYFVKGASRHEWLPGQGSASSALRASDRPLAPQT